MPTEQNGITSRALKAHKSRVVVLTLFVGCILICCINYQPSLPSNPKILTEAPTISVLPTTSRILATPSSTETTILSDNEAAAHQLLTTDPYPLYGGPHNKLLRSLTINDLLFTDASTNNVEIQIALRGKHPLPHRRRSNTLFSEMVAGIISDGKFSDRIDLLLGIKRKDDNLEEVGWLKNTFHTFLMFDDRQQLSHKRGYLYGGQIVCPKNGSSNGNQFSPELLNAAVTVEYIEANDKLRKAPNAAWKPWSTLLFFASERVQRYLLDKEIHKKKASNANTLTEEDRSPLWYAILDDDAFTFAYHLIFVLEPYTAQLRIHHANKQATPFYFYGGHRITYCPTCSPRKRFPFVFGGNGIFLSRDAVVALAAPAVVAECRELFSQIAGDEQLGGCVARSLTLKSLHEENIRNRSASQNRSYFGFEAIDLFQGAVYDTPSYTLGYHYLHSLPLAPFPISFHHVKDETDVRLLSSIESAWFNILDQIPTDRTLNKSNAIQPLIPWTFLAGLLLGDHVYSTSAVINSSLLTSHDGGPPVKLWLAKLAKDSSLHFNNVSRLFPQYFEPNMIARRLYDEQRIHKGRKRRK